MKTLNMNMAKGSFLRVRPYIRQGAVWLPRSTESANTETASRAYRPLAGHARLPAQHVALSVPHRKHNTSPLCSQEL
jgi:hypothetical protein